MDPKRIKDEITARGLKQSWIAERLEISASLLSLYLHSKRPIPESIKERLAELLRPGAAQ